MKSRMGWWCGLLLAAGCASLSPSEKADLQHLKDRGLGESGFEGPNSKAAAGALNLLPGVGNFYLAAGRGGDVSQAWIGVANFCLWPISVVWGIPEAVLDAGTLNDRERIYQYRFDPEARKIAEQAGVVF